MVAFAGFDPISRAVTAAARGLALGGHSSLAGCATTSPDCCRELCAVVILHLFPLPTSLRALLQPGFRDFIAPGWAPLSLAPWATLWRRRLVVAARSWPSSRSYGRDPKRSSDDPDDDRRHRDRRRNPGASGRRRGHRVGFSVCGTTCREAGLTGHSSTTIISPKQWS